MQAAFADSSYSQACFTFLPWCVGCPWLEYCTDLTFNIKPLLHQSHPSLCWRFLSFSILRARRGIYVGLINSTSTLLIATAPSLLIHIHPFIEPLWSNILSQNPLYYIIIIIIIFCCRLFTIAATTLPPSTSSTISSSRTCSIPR